MPVNEVAGTVSHIVKQAISIPGLSEAAKLLDSLYKVAEDVRIRRRQLNRLIKSCSKFLDVLCDALSKRKNAVRVAEAITEMQQNFTDLLAELQIWADFGYLKLLWRYFDFKVCIDDGEQTIRDMWNKFGFEAQTAIWNSVAAVDSDPENVNPCPASSEELTAALALGPSTDLEERVQFYTLKGDQLQTSSIPHYVLHYKATCNGRNFLIKQFNGDLDCRASYYQELSRRAKDWQKIWDSPEGQQYITPMHGYGSQARALPYIVTSYEDHGHIRGFLKTNMSYDCARFIKDVAHAVVLLHSENIVHGNIRLTNIMIHGEHAQLRARVSDPGIRQIVQQVTRGMFSATGSCLSIDDDCFAPEIRNATTLKVIPTIQSDVYSFGVVVLQILTCHTNTPFKLSSPMPPTKPVIAVERLGDQGLDDCLWNLLVACLDEKPVGRPAVSAVLNCLNMLFPDHDG